MSDDEDDIDGDDDEMDEGVDVDNTSDNVDKKPEPRFTRRKGIL